MFQGPIDPAAEKLHSAWCDCTNCASPVRRLARVERDRRWLRVHAIVFVAAIIGFYGMLAWYLPQVLVAFGLAH
ncbi:hypothetical protein HMF7854_04340 [Sphingomonas ginkgonis]|uniref:Uncharacterized protein n=1 Tax=Sphingomonas ginkgonis TaxID=2315330 RepID=A0A429V872_9SPHN|nr:hypothetical protein [Sphingomonas ginkgonis]RST30139.1 hypothetical protein HMF7854_04340 [Sphingomonas ginkgonis]